MAALRTSINLAREDFHYRAPNKRGPSGMDYPRDLPGLREPRMNIAGANPRGSTTPATSHGLRTLSPSLANNPEAAASAVAQQEQNYYDRVFRPLNRQLMDEVDSTKIVDEAKEQIATSTTAADAAARSERQAARFGLGGSALDLRRSAVSSGLSEATDNADLINNARVQQFERNQGLREQLTAIGRGIATNSADSLNTAANLQNQRENNNRNIKAQNDAARTQTIGSVAGMALMAAAMFM